MDVVVEAILLIIHLCAGHTDIQKLITFENAFERVFSIIDMEGGVEGGIVAQDCLQLLSNLLSYNVSNQSFFRETGGIPKLAKLLNLSEEEVMPFAKEQRDTNIQYALRLVRLFVVPGGLGTTTNQNLLTKSEILQLVLKIAFSASCDMLVRAEALKAVADLIDGNAPLQQGFAQMSVALPEIQQRQQKPPDGSAEEVGVAECFVIEALLDLALLNSSINAFDARLAACRCLEAYFNGNQPVRDHFLRHAIDLHSAGDESANALTCLSNLDNQSKGDPYRIWIASVVLIHIIYDDMEAKVLATAIREGDAEAGEEVVTAIQGISANLITALQHQYDPRICIGYLMLLCIWLYEDSDAVDDFLSEGASVQSLVGAVKENGVDPLVQGLSAFLLGILYEYSHKESPVPRATLHPILSSRMGRDLYVNKITKLRSHPLIRDFEVSKEDFMPGFRRRKHGLPEVYFDQIFIEFFKDNYSQVLHAIDKDPGLDTQITANGVTKVSNGVSLELMDSLKSQLGDKEEALSKLENTRLTLEQQLSREQHEVQRFRETSAANAQKHREAIETLKKRHEGEAATKEERNRSLVDEITKRNRRVVEEKDAQIAGMKKQLSESTNQSKAAQSEVAGLKRQFGELERRSKTMLEEKEVALGNLRKQAEDLVKRTHAAVSDKEERIKELQRQLEDMRRDKDAAEKREEEVRRENETAMAAAGNNAAVANERASHLESELQKAKEQIIRLQATRDELHAASSGLRSELDAMKAARASAESKAETAEEKLKSLQSGLKSINESQSQLMDAAEEVKGLKAQVEKASKEGEEAAKKLKTAVEKAIVAQKEKKEAVEKAKSTQNELDDLFMVLGDLEDKRKADKVRYIPRCTCGIVLMRDRNG
jgi:hypothetical protein